MNSLNDIVLPFPGAFGGASGPDKLYLSSTISGSALHAVGKEESDGEPFTAKFVQGIFALTIDEFCSCSGGMFPNHIKIDVDGTEEEIIRGMTLTMRDRRLRSIMIEINGEKSVERIEELICNTGFNLADQEQWEGKNSYNKLFLRSS